MHELALMGRVVAVVESRVRCGADVTMETFVDPCSCGSREIDVVGGKELRIETVEVQ